jgi:hypothetical protein
MPSKHTEVEARFRQLLKDAELPEPDEVEYEPGAVVFLWHATKTAVVVDFDELPACGQPQPADTGWPNRSARPRDRC